MINFVRNVIKKVIISLTARQQNQYKMRQRWHSVSMQETFRSLFNLLTWNWSENTSIFNLWEVMYRLVTIWKGLLMILSFCVSLLEMISCRMCPVSLSDRAVSICCSKFMITVSLSCPIILRNQDNLTLKAWRFLLRKWPFTNRISSERLSIKKPKQRIETK